MRVIAMGQEAVLREVLAADGLDLQLVDFSVEKQLVVARYRGGTGLCFVRLGFTEDESPGGLRVVGVRTASKSLALALKRHIEARLRGAEIRTVEVEIELAGRAPPPHDRGGDDFHVDVQEAGFVAGCKPAIRQTLGQTELDALTRRLGAHGALVEVAGEVDFGKGPLLVVCVARHRIEVEALRAAEHELLASGPDADPLRISVLHRQVGKLLGYPDCCVEAFVGRVRADMERPAGHLRWNLPFQAAREARVASNLARLNNLRLGEANGFISFEPCRYDCTEASRFAAAMADAVERIDAPSRGAMDRALVGDIVLGAAGPRASVMLDDGRIREAAAIARTREGPDSVDLDFARRLIGLAVPDSEDPDRLLIRFKNRTSA